MFRPVGSEGCPPVQEHEIGLEQGAHSVRLKLEDPGSTKLGRRLCVKDWEREGWS